MHRISQNFRKPSSVLLKFSNVHVENNKFSFFSLRIWLEPPASLIRRLKEPSIEGPPHILLMALVTHHYTFFMARIDKSLHLSDFINHVSVEGILAKTEIGKLENLVLIMPS